MLSHGFGAPKSTRSAATTRSSRSSGISVTALPAKRIVTTWRLTTSIGSKRPIGAAGADQAVSLSKGRGASAARNERSGSTPPRGPRIRPPRALNHRGGPAATPTPPPSADPAADP